MFADPLVPHVTRGGAAAVREAVHGVRRLPSLLARQDTDSAEARHPPGRLLCRRHSLQVRWRAGALAYRARELSAYRPDAYAHARREDSSGQPSAGANSRGAVVRTRAHRRPRPAGRLTALSAPMAQLKSSMGFAVR